MTRKVTKAERQEAIDRLREILKPGDTVYTIVKHVSRSGMQRHISPFIVGDDCKPQRLGHLVARAIDQRIGDDGAVIMNGCGMDMGFDLVYQTARVLFPDGFGVVVKAYLYPQGVRPATIAEADKLRMSGVKFCGRNGDTYGWDSNGGYALKQEWL